MEWRIIVIADSTSDSKVQAFFANRCRLYSLNSAAYDDLQNHLNKFLSYLQYSTNLLPNGKQQFCEVEKDKLNNYMKSLARDMSPCFPNNEKYLPNFFYESFSSFLHFLCDNRMKNIDSN